MIGIIAESADCDVISEFFELFKTPWEFYKADRQYGVVLCCNADLPPTSAKFILAFSSAQMRVDVEHQIHRVAHTSGTTISFDEGRLPLYGQYCTFSAGATFLVLDEQTERPVVCQIETPASTIVRIGFDLFREVRFLLAHGQPARYAIFPTLDIQIALLRELIVRLSIPVVEIPPVPEGYSFIVCLTHDVDHVGIRNHKCDPTMLGFLYRALIRSLVDVCRGRRTVRELVANWVAAFSLPFVYGGLAEDFWNTFDRYLEIEQGLTSTFFVIPKKGDPGHDAHGRCLFRRAARYDVTDIANHLERLRAAGREIGLHGIDAWRDRDKGREERERIVRVTGAAELGVRMHWLFFDQQSPATLDEAGFSYDSTVGYNETVGICHPPRRGARHPLIQRA